MVQKRKGHACAIRQNITYVIGGEWGSAMNTMEMWDGYSWKSLNTPVGDVFMDGNLLLQNTKLYLFTTWGKDSEWWHGGKTLQGSEIWEIDEDNNFRLYGNMTENMRGFTVFTIPHYFLMNCKGS